VIIDGVQEKEVLDLLDMKVNEVTQINSPTSSNRNVVVERALIVSGDALIHCLKN
jgi:hypothetical protein